jgi:hypothetical protein
MVCIASLVALSACSSGSRADGEASAAVIGSACIDNFEGDDARLRSNTLGGADIKPGQTLQRCFGDPRTDIYDGFYFEADGSSSYTLELTEPGDGLASFVSSSDINQRVNFTLSRFFPNHIEEQALTTVPGKNPKLAQASGVLAAGTYFLRLDVPLTGAERGSFGYKFALTKASGQSANVSLASITATAQPGRKMQVTVSLTSAAGPAGANVAIDLPLGSGWQDDWFVPEFAPHVVPHWSILVPAGQRGGSLTIPFAPKSVTTSTPCLNFQASLNGAVVFSERSPSDITCLID